MRVIKRQRDLDLLKRMQALPPDVILFAQGEFQRLYEAYGEAEDIPLEEFHTDRQRCGGIVLLESGDSLEELGPIGLPGGFRNNFAEFVERRHTGVRPLYRVFFLFDNDFGLTLLFEAGINDDAEFEAWLEDEAGWCAQPTRGGSSGEWLEELPF